MAAVAVEGDVDMSENGTSADNLITDTYQACLDHEEDEISRRTDDDDQKTFKSVCDHMRMLMKRILGLKSVKAEKPEQKAIEVEEIRVQVLMLMLTLRRLSRVQKVRLREARDATLEKRQSVEVVTLQLQNLLYEIAHLKKEVRRCLEFQSADQTIDLIPVDQFYQEAPSAISRLPETSKNEHQQRLARLHWELEQRRDQTQLFDKLTAEKEAVSAEIAQLETKLASIAPRITTILEATRPLQVDLDLPMDELKEQHRLARFLPYPLYTLWVQTSAYAEVCDARMSVEVIGDAELARKSVFVKRQEEVLSYENLSDSDNEAEPAEEGHSRKKQVRNKSKMEVDRAEEDNAVNNIDVVHPLAVKVTLLTRDGDCMVLTFSHLTNLRIVMVNCTLNFHQKLNPSPVLNIDTFIDCLFAEDDGSLSPNPATSYLLTGRLLPISLHPLGKAYKWAQALAGLVFSDVEMQNGVPIQTTSGDTVTVPPPKPTVGNTEVVMWQVSVNHMHRTVKALRRRLEARLMLAQQLELLKTTTSTSGIQLPNDFVRNNFPGKVTSEIRSWQPLTWDEYKAVASTQLIIGAGLVNPSHFLFNSIFERKHVHLSAFVAISPDHPYTAPLMSLTLLWDGEHYAEENPHVRQMEAETNVHWEELVLERNHRLLLLPALLLRLAVCLDVYTEATSAHLDSTDCSSSAQFPKEKIFFRATRGRDRALPFKYLPKLAVFTQR